MIRSLILTLCLALAAIAAPTGGDEFMDAEAAAKEAGASFHWFPIQKTFILVTAKDTAKFAIGIPFVSHNSNVVDLKSSPKLENGHLWINKEDAYKLFPNLVPASSSSAAPSSSSVAPSSSSVALSSSVAVSSSAAPVVATPAATPTPAAVPVVAAPKNETAGTREVKTIVIDPGHGGKDTGAQGKKSNEKDIVLAIGKLLKKELEKEGFNVKMTRDKDVFIELGQRANLANQWDGDLFISLHCNAIDATPERKKQIKGYHVYVLRAPKAKKTRPLPVAKTRWPRYTAKRTPKKNSPPSNGSS